MPEALDFLPTLLTAATNIGSLLCDGIGDAVLIQGEEAPGQALRLSYNILAGGRFAHFQDRLRGVSIVRPDLVQSPNHDRADQSGDRRISKA